MTLSLEGWPSKAKEAPSPHEVRLALLDTNPVFQSLGVSLGVFFVCQINSTYYKHLQQINLKRKYNIKYKRTTTTEPYTH